MIDRMVVFLTGDRGLTNAACDAPDEGCRWCSVRKGVFSQDGQNFSRESVFVRGNSEKHLLILVCVILRDAPPWRVSRDTRKNQREDHMHPTQHNPSDASTSGENPSGENPSGKNSRRATPTVKTIAAAIAAGLCASSSLADIVQAIWAPNYCRYRITDMPDYDQRRLSGLPVDGSMSCVPTAVMNLYGYAAHHGYPFVAPGLLDYRLYDNQQTMTNFIGLMGDFMGTTQDGTTGGGLVEGLATWNSVLAAGMFVVQHRHGEEVNIDSIGQAATLGGILRVGWGRWKELPAGLITRTGGHSVTLARIERDPASIQLWVRDPAQDEGDEATWYVRRTLQSEFQSKRFDVAYRDFGDLGYRSYLDLGLKDGVYRILDGYTSLRPASGLTWKQTGTAEWSIESLGLPGFGGVAQDFAFGPDVADVASVAYDAAGLDAVVLVKLPTGDTQLRRVNFAAGTSSVLQDPNISGALQQVVVGRHGQIYTHNGEKIFCLAPDGTIESYTSAVLQPAALGYDDSTDSVFVLSPNQRKLTQLDRSLGLRAQMLVPDNMPLGEGSMMCVAADGTVHFGFRGDARIGRFQPNMSWGLLEMPGLGGIQSISAGDADRLYVSNGKSLRVMRKLVGAAGVSWEYDTASYFDEQPIRTGFEMLRSRNNFDPDLYTGPGWQDIHADDLEEIGEPVADCSADLNGDDVVDSADLSLVLANWGSTTITFDVNEDGVTDSADLSLLLASWGACP